MDQVDGGIGARRDRRLSRRDVLVRATYGLGGLVAAGGTGALLHPPSAAAASGGGAAAVGTDATRLSGAAQPRSVCSGRSATLVVGETDTGQAVSWRSRDGRSWDEHRLPPPTPGEPDVWGVAAHGDRFVAVGSLLWQQPVRVRPDDAAADRTDVTFAAARRAPAVWWTVDGATWEGETLDGVDATHAQLIAVSCHTELLVAVGSTLDADGAQGDGGLVLVSPDGIAWEPGEVSGPDGSVLPEGSFTGVTAAGDAWFATSSDMAGGAVWSSGDGRHWALVDSSRARFAGMTLQGITVRGRRVIVAATSLADHRTSYHTSRDGCRTWQDGRPRVRAMDAVDATVMDVGTVDGEIVVVGTRGDLPVIEKGLG